MEEDEYGRRPRSRNWNTAEKFFLFEHVKNRFDIITDPRKETASINAKRKVWEQIYQAISKEFGPLEEQLKKGKGGEKCRTQWKNLVQAARKEYKQYMEAKMVGKRHNMTLLSRKICRLMSIDLDDGVGDDNEENDWTEDHPEFRYQPELCQELKEVARRINEEYATGVYDTLPDSIPDEYEDDPNYIEEVSESEEPEDPDDEKDEDYAPSAKRSRKSRRSSSGGRSSGARSSSSRRKTPSKATPTRVSARAQAAELKRLEEQKKATTATTKRQKAAASNTAAAAAGQEVQYQNGTVVAALGDDTQQEILALHQTEHKKRMSNLNAEHKARMQNLKLEKEIMDMQKEYWSKKLADLSKPKDEDKHDYEAEDEKAEVEGGHPDEEMETGDVAPAPVLKTEPEAPAPPSTTAVQQAPEEPAQQEAKEEPAKQQAPEEPAQQPAVEQPPEAAPQPAPETAPQPAPEQPPATSERPAEDVIQDATPVQPQAHHPVIQNLGYHPVHQHQISGIHQPIPNEAYMNPPQQAMMQPPVMYPPQHGQIPQ